MTTEKRAQIVGCLTEGNSLRATARMTGAAINTVVKLLLDLGDAAWSYQDKTLRNLPCKRVQVDEIWSFVYAKERNLPNEFKGRFGYGDVWTWTAICADTKLVPSWFVGSRNADCAQLFIYDLSHRLNSRIQLTSDGHSPYLEAVENAFGDKIDYSMLVKIYGQGPEGQRRYSPPECIGTKRRKVTGNPDPKHVSTSYVERQNLTMRMSMRRFTRLTNGFSKKVENLAAAVSLHYLHYNFARVHQSLRVTPAMEAGVADHVWSLEEIAGLTDNRN
ncbi:MAG: IS1 family transposase [SAR324 cluster bacterium]|nr:IS1 family transposase [SAR324 cluster bacterium]